MMGAFCAPFVSKEQKIAYPTPEKMPFGWIASRDVSALVVEAICNPNLIADSFLVSGLENLKGNDLAEHFSRGVGERIVYYTQPPAEFKSILSPYVGEAAAGAVASFYEILQSSAEYPSKFNPNMSEVLEKLPVKMTTMEEWSRANKNYFINK